MNVKSSCCEIDGSANSVIRESGAGFSNKWQLFSWKLGELVAVTSWDLGKSTTVVIAASSSNPLYNPIFYKIY